MKVATPGVTPGAAPVPAAERPQSWDPQRYARNARFVADLAGPLLDLLAPQAGEDILDLGCGDGHLSRKIAGCGAKVRGIDSSHEQVAAARAMGVDAEVGCGMNLKFAAEFDAVFSNAALHWMLRPDAVVAGVWRALRPGGRFVAEMGGAGNVDLILRALVRALDARGHDGRAAVPWYFPGPEEHRKRLEKAGFQVDVIELIPRPTPLPGALSGWLQTFAESFINVLQDDDQRRAYMEEVERSLAPHLKDGAGVWSADYVRLRFHARKPIERGRGSGADTAADEDA